MKKNTYKRPSITKVNLDNEINLVLMSTPYGDPTTMEMQNAMAEDEIDYYFLNPLKWFK
jgi:hypothetical protein